MTARGKLPMVGGLRDRPRVTGWSQKTPRPPTMGSDRGDEDSDGGVLGCGRSGHRHSKRRPTVTGNPTSEFTPPQG